MSANYHLLNGKYDLTWCDIPKVGSYKIRGNIDDSNIKEINININDVNENGTPTVTAEREDEYTFNNSSKRSFLIALSGGRGFNWLSRHGIGNVPAQDLCTVLKELLYQIESSDLVLDKEEFLDNFFEELPDWWDEDME